MKNLVTQNINDALITVEKAAFTYLNLDLNLTGQDLTSKEALIELIDFIQELYEELKKLYDYIDIDLSDVSEIYSLQKALVELADNLLDGIDEYDTEYEDYEVVSLQEAFTFLLSNGYPDNDELIDEELLEQERRTYKFLSNVINNIDAINKVGVRFGLEVYELEEELLYDSEYLDILLEALKQLNSDLSKTNEYEELEALYDAVAEVYVGLTMLKSLLNKLVLLRHR